MIRIGSRETASPLFAAALTLRCPRCNAAPGVECQQKRSRRVVWPPHETRVKKLRPRLGRDERSRKVPGRDWGSAGNVVLRSAGASARQVPRVPGLFVVITALVLAYFGCIR